ncbi:MAG TPA: sulfite exporter TauE/SafE family protein [Syntrophobacteraceae bacterium]|nr:sulfite exporter TauE/SafE family protein [Syntrophobacteraceae bacterium]
MGPFSPHEYFWLIGLGLAVGLYGTLIGAGGGFILMPLLLLLYPKASPEQLTAVSLAVVFFNALAGSESYAMMRRIDYKSGLLFAAATIPGAIIGALSTSRVPRPLFDAIFGGLLLAAGVFLFFRTPLAHNNGAKRHLHHPSATRHLVSATGEEFDYNFNPLLGMAISFVVGFASSFLGIGGGIIHVPALIFFLDFPVHVATATSHFILAIMALTGTIVHIWMGTFHEGARHTLSLSIGVLLGAPVGAYLSSRIGGSWIVRSLGLALGLVGLRILALLL